MKTYNDDRLDGFEAALLAELRDEVVRRRDGVPVEAPAIIGDDTPAAPAIRSSAGRRMSWAIGAAAAAVGAVALAATLTNGTPAAYAVTTDTDGAVVVTIHELKDATGLEAALAKHGVNATVTYAKGEIQLPVVEMGEGTEATIVIPDDADAAAGQIAIQTFGAGDDPDDQQSDQTRGGCIGSDEVATATVERDGAGWRVTVPKDSIIRHTSSAWGISSSGRLAVLYEPVAGQHLWCSVVSPKD